jgi:ELWxxDGT repeat protein
MSKTIGTIAALLLLFGPARAAAPAHLLKDVNTSLTLDSGSRPEFLCRLGSITLFRAQTLDLGTELWRTDGTTPGTSLVKDINPGSGSSQPGSCAVIGAPCSSSPMTASTATRCGGRTAPRRGRRS